MAGELILAHDLGTSGDKASLHDRSGRLLAATTAAYATDFGPGGKAEQDPEAWWSAFAASSRQLLEGGGWGPADVACVTFSGQMQGAVLVDEAGHHVRPAMIWADTRAQAESAAIRERVGAERAYAITGHRLDPTYTLAKVCWVREHEPEAWRHTRHILQAKDYLVLRLTGRAVSDPSDASGTNAYDQAAGAWSAELLAASELDLRLFPQVVPSASVAGELSAEAAAGCGLGAGTPVVVGGGDGSCAALGAGLVARESGANTYLGSSAWISLASERPLHDPEMRTMTFNHVIPGCYVPIGTMQAGGASLDWIVGTLAPGGGAQRYRELLAAAAEVEAAAAGLFFLPHLLGERSPYWNPLVRGMFLGLARHHGPAHLVRAVLEGVAFNLLTCLRALESMAGPIDSVDAIGGGARSDLWLQVIADLWGISVRRRSLVDEANALGAAVVGAMAIGTVSDWEVARGLSSVEATFEPDARRHDRYLRWHARFRDAYDRLEPWFDGTHA